MFVVIVSNVMGFDWLFGPNALIGQNWPRCVIIYRVPCRMSDVRSHARIDIFLLFLASASKIFN